MTEILAPLQGARSCVLHPGDVASGARGDRFETLLGSCVAVVLTDPRRTFGTACHIVHAADAPAARPRDTRFADAAVRAMRDRLAANGLQLSHCEAWVAGGGNMFPGLLTRHHIGERNVERVLQLLDAEGVRVVGIDAGGLAYRRLRWTVGPDAPAVEAVSVRPA